jgi:hypothetical protein
LLWSGPEDLGPTHLLEKRDREVEVEIEIEIERQRKRESK